MTCIISFGKCYSHLQFLYCYCINVTCPIPEICILLVQSFFEVTPYFYLILYYIAFSKSANISICFVPVIIFIIIIKKFSSRSYYIKYLSYITHEYNRYSFQICILKRSMLNSSMETRASLKQITSAIITGNMLEVLPRTRQFNIIFISKV